MARVVDVRVSGAVSWMLRRGNTAIGPGTLRVLGLIVKLTQERGFPPTIGELARAYPCHHYAVVCSLMNLELQGLVETDSGAGNAARVSARTLVPRVRFIRAADLGRV